MKFQMHPCDDGRFFIVDTDSDEVLVHTRNRDLAIRVTDQMNVMDDDGDDLDGMFEVAQIH